jgi:type I restriction enzyme S subunit
MKNESHGSTMLHVTKGGMEKLLIQLPPLQEQQKIAEILSTVDAKIEIIDQQILETQELKKGLMQQLLTKGIGHTEFKDSVLGKIPKSWEVVKLEKLIKIQSGISPSSVDFLDKGSQMFYKVSQLNDYDKYMDKSPYRFENNIRDNIPAKSIAFPKRGAAIFTNKVRVLSFAAMVDTNIMCLIPNKKIYNEFLFYFLLDFGLSRIADTSSIPQINNKHINPLKIALPSIKEQHKIAEILSATDKKLEVLSEKKTTYQELKQGLMQHLLTGKVRV